MNLLKILQLPRWVLTDVHPAFHDSESMTVLEQTSRLYGKMKELIDSYNAWVEETNRLIVEYKNEEDMQDDEFENRIIETMNNYIASVDEKLACQDREFDEVRGLIDDLNANIKVEVETATRSIIETMKSSGEFNDIILSTLDEVNERLSSYEQEINQKFSNLQAEMQASIDIVTNASTDITNLKTDNDKNKNDILTLQTNYYSLDGTVDNLVDDNTANKNTIEEHNSLIENLQGEIIYSGGNTISKNLNEFKYIEVFYRGYVADKTYSESKKVFVNNANSINVNLSIGSILQNSSLKSTSRCIHIDGVSVTFSNNGSHEITSTGGVGSNTTAQISVQRIIGYK